MVKICYLIRILLPERQVNYVKLSDDITLLYFIRSCPFALPTSYYVQGELINNLKVTKFAIHKLNFRVIEILFFLH